MPASPVAADITSPLTRARAGRAPSRRRARHGAGLTPYLYLLPGLAIYTVLVLVPLGQAAWYSLYTWDGVTTATWNGIGNYTALLNDPQVKAAFAHALILVVFYCVIPIAIGLPLAALVARVTVRGAGAYRTMLFLPQVVATVVIALAWRWIYSEDGPLNAFLRGVGLGGLARAWLGDFTTALPAIGLVGSWTTTGLCMVIFIVGVQRVPAELYEAARIDGATPIQEFFAITLPSVRQELAVAATLTVIAALRTFDLIYVATSGGPGDQTIVPGMLIYRRAFREGDVGSATAIAVVLALLLIAVAFVLTRLADRDGGTS